MPLVHEIKRDKKLDTSQNETVQDICTTRANPCRRSFVMSLSSTGCEHLHRYYLLQHRSISLKRTCGWAQLRTRIYNFLPEEKAQDFTVSHSTLRVADRYNHNDDDDVVVDPKFPAGWGLVGRTLVGLYVTFCRKISGRQPTVRSTRDGWLNLMILMLETHSITTV